MKSALLFGEIVHVDFGVCSGGFFFLEGEGGGDIRFASVSHDTLIRFLSLDCRFTQLSCVSGRPSAAKKTDSRRAMKAWQQVYHERLCVLPQA